MTGKRTEKKDLKEEVDSVIDDVWGGLEGDVRDDFIRGSLRELTALMERKRADKGRYEKDSTFRNRLMTAGDVYSRLTCIEDSLSYIVDMWDGDDHQVDFIPKKDVDLLRRLNGEVRRLINEMDGRMSIWLVEVV